MSSSFAGRHTFHLVLSTIEVLIEIEEVEQIVFGFQGGVVPVQLHKESGRAVPFFGNEANIVLLLKFEHFVLGRAQIFFGLNELLGDAGNDELALVFSHPLLKIEILLHDGIQIRLCVIRGAADRRKLED